MKAPTGKLAFAYRTIAALEVERDTLRAEVEQLQTERDTLRAVASTLHDAMTAAGMTPEDAAQLPALIAAWRKGAARYERVRRLDPNQFGTLWQRNIQTGERFDDLVDEATTP